MHFDSLTKILLIYHAVLFFHFEMGLSAGQHEIESLIWLLSVALNGRIINQHILIGADFPQPIKYENYIV